MTFTFPTCSPKIRAFPFAVKGNSPMRISPYCSLAPFSLNPTLAISGAVYIHQGTA